MATEGKQEEEVHVLLVSLAMQGHINPMLMLAKLLMSKGLHVTLAITESELFSFHNDIVSTTSAKLYVNFFSDGFDDEFDRQKNSDHYFDSLPIYGSRNLSNLIDKLSNVRKFSYIVNTPFLPWVVDVAIQHGIPCAMLWIQPSALFSMFYRFYKDLSTFPTLENLDIPIDLPALPLLDVDDMPGFIHPSNPFPGIGKALSDMVHGLDKVKWVLGNSFYELEKEVVDSMEQLCPITPIGPLVPPTMLGKDELVKGGIDMSIAEDEGNFFEWLDKKPPASVVYISFGSVIMLSDKQAENIALALKSTKKPFIWVVKPNKEKDGMSSIPSWFTEETQEQGLVVPWCTQTRVLAHRSIGCFMSHCGWNSLMESVVSGVPVIGFPKWSDQPTNSKLVTGLFKTGVELGRMDEDKVISKEIMEKCILDIMEGPKAVEIKERAIKLKQDARTTLSLTGSSTKNLQCFVDDIRQSFFKRGKSKLKPTLSN